MKEINGLRKEINRLLSNGMSNINLKVTTETFSKLQFSGCKIFFSKVSFSGAKTSCCNLKINGLTAKLCMTF